MSEMQMHRCCSGLEEEGRGTYLWYLIVLMLKPRVGLMTLVSSPLILSTMVVFPELSRPLWRTHIASHQPQRSNAKGQSKDWGDRRHEHWIRSNLRTVGNGRIGHRKGNGGRREPTPWGCASPSPCAWSSWWCWVAPWSPPNRGEDEDRRRGRGRGMAEQGSPRPPQAEQSRQQSDDDFTPESRFLCSKFFSLLLLGRKPATTTARFTSLDLSFVPIWLKYKIWASACNILSKKSKLYWIRARQNGAKSNHAIQTCICVKKKSNHAIGKKKKLKQVRPVWYILVDFSW